MGLSCIQVAKIMQPRLLSPPLQQGTPKLSSYTVHIIPMSFANWHEICSLFPAAAKRVRDVSVALGGKSNMQYARSPVVQLLIFTKSSDFDKLFRFVYVRDVTCVLVTVNLCVTVCRVHSSNYWPPQEFSRDCKSERGFFVAYQSTSHPSNNFDPLPPTLSNSFEVTWTRLVWSLVSNLPEIIISELHAISRFFLCWMDGKYACMWQFSLPLQTIQPKLRGI